MAGIFVSYLYTDMESSVTIHMIPVKFHKLIFQEQEVNVINIFYSTLLLAGSILLLIGKNESRLFRYVMATAVFSGIISIILLFSGWQRNLLYSLMDENYSANLFAALAGYTFWGVTAFFLLRYFYRIVPLQLQTSTHDGQETTYLVPAGRLQRVMNRIADLVVISSILFSNFTSTGYSEWYDFSYLTGLAILLGFIQLLYYFFFEWVFQATPGKMLTGSRVVNENGSKPSAGKIFKRSLLRLIPLEWLSGFSELWHDKWSETYVVEEQFDRKHNTRYLFTFSGCVAFSVLLPFVLNAIKEANIRAGILAQQEKEKTALINNLNTISTNDVVILQDYSDTVYLLPVKVNADSITFAFFDDLPMQDVYLKSSKNILEFYEQYKDSLDTYAFSRNELKQHVSSGDALEKLYGSFRINQIVSLYGPRIYFREAKLYDNRRRKDWTLNVVVENHGWSGQITGIKDNTDKVISYFHEFPERFPADTLSILGAFCERTDKLDITVSLKDSLGRASAYRIRSLIPSEGAASIERIK